MILHRYELGPTLSLRRMLKDRELMCPHGASAYVAYHTGLDHVVQCLHRLFGRDCRVESVDLEDVDVGCIQAFKRGLDGVENSRSG